MPAIETVGKTARFALGGVRILAGETGLLAPAMIISRFGEGNPSANPAAIYGLRLIAAAATAADKAGAPPARNDLRQVLARLPHPRKPARPTAVQEIR